MSAQFRQVPISTAIARRLMVRPWEIRSVGYFFLIFLLIGIGLAIGRGTAYALFFKRYGIEYLPEIYLVLGFLLMVTSALYAAYSDRMPAERLFRVLYVLLPSALAGNWLLMHHFEFVAAYPVYFLLFEVASEVLIVHFALYLHQNLDLLQSKRLSPLIFAGLQFGTMLGGVALAYGAGRIGTDNMMLVWCGTLLAGVPLLSRHHRSVGTSPFFRHGAKMTARKNGLLGQWRQGLLFIARSTLLRMIMTAMFFMVISFYVLSYSVNLIYTEEFHSADQLTSFFGLLTAVSSVIALALQVLVTNRLIQRLGVARSNLIYPVTTIISFGGLLVSFTFPFALIGSLNREAIHTAIRNPVRNLFFHALPGFMQGRARAIGLALVLPLALICAGLLLIYAQQLENRVHFLMIGAAAAVLYLVFSLRMSKAYTRELLITLKDRVHLPEGDIGLKLGQHDSRLLEEILRGIEHPDREIQLGYVRMLMEASPVQAAEILLPRLRAFDIPLQTRIVQGLAAVNPPGLGKCLSRLSGTADGHLRAELLRYFIDQGDRSKIPEISAALHDSNPRLRAMAVYGIVSFAESGLIDQAAKAWRDLLGSALVEESIAGLDLLAIRSEPLYESELVSLLAHEHPRVLSKALTALERWDGPPISALFAALTRVFANPDAGLRTRAIMCTTLLPYSERMALVHEALEDNHPAVRKAAVRSLSYEQDGLPDFLQAGIVDHRYSIRTQLELLAELVRNRPKKSRLEEIAHAKAEDAVAILHAREFVKMTAFGEGGGTGAELTQHVLCERLHETLEVILAALEYTEDAEAIGIIRVGLRSKDSRHVASAAEVLHNIADPKLAGIMDTIIDGMHGNQHAEELGTLQFRKLDEVRRWSAKRNDPWLMECINRMMAQRGIARV